MYTLSLPPDSMNFDFSIPDVAESAYILERSRNNDTLQVWLTDSTLISQPLITTLVKYPLTDSTGIEKYITDTINMRFIAPRAPRVAKKEIKSFKMETNIGSGSLKPGNKILLSYQTPLLGLDTTRIRIYDVSDSIKKSVSYKLYKDTLNANRYIIDADLKFGKKYLYIADSAAFYNLLRQYSDSTGIRFAIKDPEAYSSLTLLISDYEGPRIIQLLNKTEELIREKHTSTNGKILFPLLDVGIYRARVIYDLNNDGKWTTGDFKSHRQPEPASYYPDEIDLKLGWNAEQEWPMGKLNYKDPKLRKKPTANK